MSIEVAGFKARSERLQSRGRALISATFEELIGISERFGERS
jgi:hypothetical protein